MTRNVLCDAGAGSNLIISNPDTDLLQISNLPFRLPARRIVGGFLGFNTFIGFFTIVHLMLLAVPCLAEAETVLGPNKWKEVPVPIMAPDTKMLGRNLNEQELAPYRKAQTGPKLIPIPGQSKPMLQGSLEDFLGIKTRLQGQDYILQQIIGNTTNYLWKHTSIREAPLNKELKDGKSPPPDSEFDTTFIGVYFEQSKVFVAYVFDATLFIDVLTVREEPLNFDELSHCPSKPVAQLTALFGNAYPVNKQLNGLKISSFEGKTVLTIGDKPMKFDWTGSAWLRE